MMKTAWVFPGQGSQHVNMAKNLPFSSIVQVRFEQAEQILGWSVPECCAHADFLAQTRYTQPCLFVISAILADGLRSRGEPAIVAGHSLGELTALYAAGVFDFETGLELVRQRSALMQQVSVGSMVALIGCDRSQLEEQLQQTEDVVLANDNHLGQVVISGLPNAIEALLAKVPMRRSVPLEVSGAFHSPIVAEAASAFEQVLDAVTFQPAQVPVLSNVDPTPAIAPEVLKARLKRQMTGMVRWREMAQQLEREGVQRAIEVGPGDVLTKLIQYTCAEMELDNTTSMFALAAP